MPDIPAEHWFLTGLARHLEPKASTQLDDVRNLLLVTVEGCTVQVEVISTVTTAVTQVLYRDVRTGRVYGAMTEPEVAATQILARLSGGASRTGDPDKR